MYKFQFTPLREGRLPARFSLRASCTYFNSRPSARGDKSSIVPLKHPQISIHAPPRGATLYFCSNKNEFLISIHAPPRGATVPVFSMPTSTVNFNSRPSARGDASRADLSADGILFQFTPLREGRLLRGKYAQGVHNFNSRPSARGDH